MKLRRIVPVLYLAVAAYAWVDFLRLPTDGLANVGLMLVTLPVTLVGLVLTELAGGEAFVLLPSGFGYYVDHALYYWPSVGATALLLYWIAAIFT
jgi:hypothetical protein